MSCEDTNKSINEPHKSRAMPNLFMAVLKKHISLPYRIHKRSNLVTHVTIVTRIVSTRHTCSRIVQGLFAKKQLISNTAQKRKMKLSCYFQRSHLATLNSDNLKSKQN